MLAKRANLFLQVMSSYGVGLNNGQLVSQFTLPNEEPNLGLRTKGQFYTTAYISAALLLLAKRANLFLQVMSSYGAHC